MTESKNVEVSIREAVPDDAKQLLSLLEKTAKQTDFVTYSHEDRKLTVEEEKKELAALYNSSNNCVLLALAGEEVIGMASINGSTKPKEHHIGEVGIVIDESFWGLGLGQAMMEELIGWAEESGAFARLELKVQKRNTRAHSLYQKVGFKEEAILERGVKVSDEYLDVCLMSKLID